MSSAVRASHVAALVNAYADTCYSRWTLETVTKKGPNDETSVRFLNKLNLREWSEVDREFRSARFRQAMRMCSMYLKRDVLDWWLITYLPANKSNAEVVLTAAIQNGRIDVLDWLKNHHIMPSSIADTITCWDATTTKWPRDRGNQLSI